MALKNKKINVPGKKRGNKLKDNKIISSLSYISIPTNVFRKKSLGKPLAILESIVSYLKEERHLNYHEIAILLNRDERNIWTVYNRTKLKIKKNNKS